MTDAALILVADDNRLLQQAAVRVLGQAGYRTCIADDGQSALRVARSEKPDLILLDVVLPDMSGLEVCRQLKADPALAGCFIALLSSVRVDSPDQIEGLAGGADDYITRPIPNDELLARVRGLLRIKQAEDRLRASEESLRLAVAAGRMGTWDRDFLTGQLHWSVECKVMFGLPLEIEMNDERFTQALHPDDRAPTDRAIREALEKRTDFDTEYRVIWPDGTLHWIAAKGRGYYNEAGQPVHMAGITFDITDRKRLEGEQFRLLDIIERSLNEIYVFDAATLRFEYLNHGALYNLGYSLAEMKRLTPVDIKPDYTESTFRAMIQPLLTREQDRLVFETRHRRKNGTDYPVEVHLQLFDQTEHRVFLAIINDITDRKQAEAVLRESERRLREAQQLAHMGFWKWAVKTGEVEWSDEVFKIFSRDPAEFTPRIDSILALSPWPEEQHRDQELINKALETHNPGFYEQKFLRPDQSVGYYSSTFQGIYDETGDLVSMVGTVQDITERKRAETALQHSHNLIVKLTTQVPGVVYQYRLYPDGHSSFPFASPGMNDIYEVTPEDVQGDATPVFGRLHPDDYDLIVASIQESARTLQPFHCEFRVVLPRQGLRWRLSDALPERVEDGGTLWYGIISDITERKQAEEEIRQLNADLEQRVAERTAELSDLYNNAPCGYHSLDADGVFVRINATELNWLGYTHEEIVGKTRFADLLTPTSLITFQQNFPAFKERGWVHDLEFDMVRKDGSILPVLLNATVIADQDGQYRTSRSTMIDHTDRKRAEERMRESQTQLEAANKELEAFSYSVSHDLRAPLRGIDGWSAALLEDNGPQLDAQGRQYLERVRGETQRMGRLIDDLLHLSRVSRTDLQPAAVDLSALALTITARLQAAAQPAAAAPERQFEFVIQPNLAAYGDARLLEIALTNLLDNAVKFTGTRPVARIEFGLTQVQGQPAYFVRDNGVGFDPAYARNLFGAFQRLHSLAEFPGTGIGLATVKRIIHRHGGAIWAEAAIDQGATFYFTLNESPPLK